MGHEDVVDTQQLVELQITHPGAGIDQHIVIHKQGRRTLTCARRCHRCNPRTRSFILFSWYSSECGNWTARRNARSKKSKASASEYDSAATSVARKITLSLHKSYCVETCEKNSIFTPAIST